MSDSFLTNLQRQNAAVADLTRQERPAAAIGLRRSTSLAIALGGVAITWPTVDRSQGFSFTPTAANITIPTAGYYHIQLNYTGSAAHTVDVGLWINGALAVYCATDRTTGTQHSGTNQYYLATGDTIALVVYVSVAINITSAVCSVVQLTSVVV